MYQLEFSWILPYIKKITGLYMPKVLDVGCSGGYFLDIFKEHGFNTFGIEYGDEAVREASRKHKVFKGTFPEIALTDQFDLIIFRGVIEHVPNPVSYLKKSGVTF